MDTTHLICFSLPKCKHFLVEFSNKPKSVILQTGWCKKVVCKFSLITSAQLLRNLLRRRYLPQCTPVAIRSTRGQGIGRRLFIRDQFDKSPPLGFHQSDCPIWYDRTQPHHVFIANECTVLCGVVNFIPLFGFNMWSSPIWTDQCTAHLIHLGEVGISTERTSTFDLFGLGLTSDQS